MKKTIVFLALMGALLLTACGPKKGEPAPSRSAEAQAMLAKMKAAAEGHKVMFGHQDDTAYGHTWAGIAAPREQDADASTEGRSDTKEVCGDYPAVIGFDLGRLELGHKRNLDGVLFDKMRREIIAHYERGGIVTLSWHLDNPLTGNDAWDFHDKGTAASILPDGKLHEEFLTRMGRVADFLASIKTADGTPVPMLFRPWHEHTGSWFWWGQEICTTEQYKGLWRMTYDFMQARGLTNLLWAYSPGTEPTTQEEYFERYPGDDIVDVLGFDTYQYGPREPYLATMKRSLDILVEAAKTHGKVAAVTETGFESTPDPTWWTGTLLPALVDAPVAYVLVWRNAWDRETHHYGIYPGHESEADFVEFYKNPRTLFAKDIK